jgi:hypothetical protein
MPVRLVNTCEQAANGVAPTGADNGRRSGNAWSSINGTVTTTTAQFVHGTKSVKLDVSTSSSLQGVMWDETAFRVTTATTSYMRFYFRLESLPNVTHRWVTFGSSGGAAYLGGLLLKANGTFDLADASVTGRATSSTLALNQWYRMEIQMVSHVSAGSMTVRLFTGANLEGGTPNETISFTNQNTNGAAAQWFNIGGTQAAGIFGMWLDSAEVNDLDWPGAFVPPIPSHYETVFANGTYPFWTPATMNDFSDPSSYTMGMYFTPSKNGKVYGGAWCNHLGATSAEGGTIPQIALYPGPSGGTTAIATKVSTTTEIRGNWNYQLFDTPIPVTAGTTYMIAILRKNYPFHSSFFTSDQAQGNLTAPGVGSSNNNFFTVSPSLVKPSTAFGSTWYGVDVLYKADQTESWGVPLA